MKLLTHEEMLTMAVSTLKRKYVQRADERQKEMGLSYTEAETNDLAKTFVQMMETVIAINSRLADEE